MHRRNNGTVEKYCYRSDVTACAIKFMKTVGADLHIRPTVPSRTNPTATRHLVLVSTNWMAYGAVEKVPSLFKRNRLRHQIYANGRGRLACLP